jgi:tRNA(Ile)-lysidine synthetase-like protein
MLDRVAAQIDAHELLRPGQEVTCLVSGGADSTCLWHVLRELDYEVSAVHVAHGLRGAESDEDARFCREAFGAAVIEARVPETQSPTEAALRELRYSLTSGLRATGHTASDAVESVLLGLVASGTPQRIEPRREDGVVRPLLRVWREETRAWLDERGLAYREDSSNPNTKRGLIRERILPLLEELDPRARASLLALADERPTLPRTLERTLANLLSSREGTKAADLGGGVRAVREYDSVRLEGTVEWGPWTIESDRPGLEVRTRRPGDRLAGRSKKVQDLLVDAKVPRAERDGWPLVVSGDEVVAVPGVAEAPGWEGAVTWKR